MTRNFEEEYRKYADSTVPDLWGRIEAAIDESSRNAEKSVTDIKDYHKKENKIVTFVSKHSAYIAACACVLLTIGALSFLKGLGSAKSAAPSAASESTAAEAPADYAMDEMTNTAEAEAAEESAYEYAEEPIAEAYPDQAPSAEAPADEFYSGDFKNPQTLNIDNNAAAAGAMSESSAAKAEEVLEEAEEAQAEAETEPYDLNGYEQTMICTVDPDELRSVERASDGTHEISVQVKEPLGAAFDEGEKITLKADDDAFNSLKKLAESGKDDEYRMVIRVEMSGDLILISAEKIKK